jgi:hypothetical protein
MITKRLQRARQEALYVKHLAAGVGSGLLLFALLAFPAQAADPRESAPRSLVIAYHTAPANRLAFRQELEQSGVGQLQRWKDDGLLQSYRVLFNRYVDSASWDALALLTFAREADVERWKKIEVEGPAGLSQKALALVTSIETTPADLMRSRSAPDAPDNAVFLVIPYEVVVPVDDYIAYLDGYVLPQVDGWMEEGIVGRYGIYLARYTAGRPWQSLLVLEYRSDPALGARETVVAKVRARLKENPKWKAISDSKKNVRVEKAPVIADPLAAR